MKAKLLIDGKEIEVEISEEEYKKLQPPKEKKTGYERASKDNAYYYVTGEGVLEFVLDIHDKIDDRYYELANYYSSEIVAENNARADKLMRQLRRFAVKHRVNEIGFNNIHNKYYIRYDYDEDELGINYVKFVRICGVPYFYSKETAQAAIDEFHDELIWYFTEYKDSL